ncbi:MAG: ORF6N domain-containing protein [Kiritimatiellae bacterium]|nr:ORF6N domain-containing protein [Kiritimatiellia bacterium]
MDALTVAEPANADAIRSRILTIRGVQVMLDRDLAELYGVEVGQLNRQVKRNLERFPDDFLFQVSREECSRCQIGTLNGGRGSNIKYIPYAFTENGVAMLSGVLRSSRAIAANIQIMRAFNAMRKALASIAPLLARISPTRFCRSSPRSVRE